ncbi:hypothetical protein EVAR_11404_1 [Eumeta japonica]|uniref:Uncharacterized protein n=1 Tax=Eumeta variegata TaxID=151549 RepID=A0A4C1TND1_EUMVA|nr:hypothetical protein EVAR_11404_1 [Eumeta japonica]
MYVIYPADEVVTLTYSHNSLPRPRQRPTLDVLNGPPLRALSPAPAQPRARSLPKTAPPELAERAPASPTPSLERPKTRERTRAKLLKKLGRAEDPEFGKIVRTPAPEEFELPAPLPTPAFSRKNIFDRDFDALFEVANTPQFGAHIRVTTPEPDRQSDAPLSTPAPSPAPATSASSEYSGPPSARTSTPSTPTPKRSFFEGFYRDRFLFKKGSTNCKPKKVSFLRKWSRARDSPPRPPRANMQTSSAEMALRELTHPAHNDQLKNQQQVTFKLVKTGTFLNIFQDLGLALLLVLRAFRWNTISCEVDGREARIDDCTVDDDCKGVVDCSGVEEGNWSSN